MQQLVDPSPAVLELPPERRRPLSSRIDDILAHPRASSCREECPICSGIKPGTAQAALFVWDDFARSGVWPIRGEAIFEFLRANNLAGGDGASLKRVKRFLAHRRGSLLRALVRKDIKRWGVVSSEGDRSQGSTQIAEIHTLKISDIRESEILSV
jgi:hypothetical protein